MPPPNKELAAEQITGLCALLQDPSKPVPYVDFSLWGPYHHRLEKQIRLAGVTFDSNGNLKLIEIKGPANHKIWTEKYGCLETGLLMEDAVDLGNVRNYEDFIKEYHETLTDNFWYLIYQADNRMRLEGMERLRRIAQEEYDNCTNKASHPLDPTRPLN